MEAAGGILLLIATVIALVWANSPWEESYHGIWHTTFTSGHRELRALVEPAYLGQRWPDGDLLLSGRARNQA